jgi:hypothetical protein
MEDHLLSETDYYSKHACRVPFALRPMPFAFILSPFAFNLRLPFMPPPSR